MIDALQVFVGLAVIGGVYLQRDKNARFSSAAFDCRGDKWSTHIGQVGLAISATGAFVMVLHGLGANVARPESVALALLVGQMFIQVRVLYGKMADVFAALLHIKLGNRHGH